MALIDKKQYGIQVELEDGSRHTFGQDKINFRFEDVAEAVKEETELIKRFNRGEIGIDEFWEERNKIFGESE